jgi:hypothetical protein
MQQQQRRGPTAYSIREAQYQCLSCGGDHSGGRACSGSVESSGGGCGGDRDIIVVVAHGVVLSIGVGIDISGCANES